MSLRIAKPKVAPPSDRVRRTAASCVRSKLSWRNGMSRSVVKFGNGLVPAGRLQKPTVALCRPGSNDLARHEVGRADRAVLDVHVEVDADPLEEAVVQPDEADFDRDLQILQPAKLLQQVGNFLVHGLRLADDQAEVGGERPNFGFAAAVLGPGFGLTRSTRSGR